MPKHTINEIDLTLSAQEQGRNSKIKLDVDEKADNKVFLMEKYDVTEAVLPYIQADGGHFQLDTAVEPVVSITESNVPQLREGMQLPLHLADKLFADLDNEQIRTAHGVKPEKDCPKVAYQIRWRSQDRNQVYANIFAVGSENGGLLMSIERNANRWLTWISQHIERGNTEHFQMLIDKVIPVFYQQSMGAENKIKAEILPQPIPFYNVSYEEAVQSSDIGREAFFASHRATVECAHAIDAGLENACYHKAIYQFMNGVKSQFGAERVKAVLSATIQHKSYDGRFHEDTKAYAAQMPLRMAGTNPERDKTGDYVLNAHSVVVDGAMRAFRKMEQSQEKDRKPSIRGRLNGSPQSERKNPEKMKEQQKKRGNQCEL